MKAKIITLMLLSFLLVGCNQIADTSKNIEEKTTQSTSIIQTPTISTQQTSQPQNEPTHTAFPKIFPPITHAEKRVTKKSYGTKVSPTNSPVQPEKFTGYHTGTDFETFPEEKARDIQIGAICDGPILAKKSVSGYGGVIIQKCQLANQDITVVYGHLKLTSIKEKVGDQLTASSNFAILGAGFSTETSGERKHLHLSIKKGSKVDLRGYVQNPTELEDWLDYQKLG